jgi:murein L,D-transpeptidase YafK
MKQINFFTFLGILAFVNTSFKTLTTKDDFYIIVSKSDYTMSIYDSENTFIVSYPAVFGSKDQSDKLFEGDRRTPLGTFHIASKKLHPKWDRFMALDYPTQESYNRFNERKRNGEIPMNAKIGGGIGIHGTWPREEFAIDAQQNWTQGCVSTKNDFVREMYDQLPVGTRVEITQ